MPDLLRNSHGDTNQPQGFHDDDSSCKHRGGGKTASLVAKAVMEHTDHHLMVGAGAQQFARTMGFEILPDLNTKNSREKWLVWKQQSDPLHYIKDPDERAAAERQVLRSMVAA